MPTGLREMSKSCNGTEGVVVNDGMCLSGLRPSLLVTNASGTYLNSRRAGPKGGRQDAWSHLGRKCWNHSYGYASSIFTQPCLTRTHPHKCVGNVFEQPIGWPEGRKAGCLESFRILVQFAG